MSPAANASSAVSTTRSCRSPCSSAVLATARRASRSAPAVSPERRAARAASMSCTASPSPAPTGAASSRWSRRAVGGSGRSASVACTARRAAGGSSSSAAAPSSGDATWTWSSVTRRTPRRTPSWTAASPSSQNAEASPDRRPPRAADATATAVRTCSGSDPSRWRMTSVTVLGASARGSPSVRAVASSIAQSGLPAEASATSSIADGVRCPTLTDSSTLRTEVRDNGGTGTTSAAVNRGLTAKSSPDPSERRATSRAVTATVDDRLMTRSSTRRLTTSAHCQSSITIVVPGFARCASSWVNADTTAVGSAAAGSATSVSRVSRWTGASAGNAPSGVFDTRSARTAHRRSSCWSARAVSTTRTAVAVRTTARSRWVFPMPGSPTGIARPPPAVAALTRRPRTAWRSIGTCARVSGFRCSVTTTFLTGRRRVGGEPTDHSRSPLAR